MTIKNPDNVNWFVVIVLYVITLLGSLASYSYEILNGKQFLLWTLIAQIFISIFAGTLVIFIASYFNWEFEFAGGAAGLAGWSGANLVKILEDKFLKKLKEKE